MAFKKIFLVYVQYPSYIKVASCWEEKWSCLVQVLCKIDDLYKYTCFYNCLEIVLKWVQKKKFHHPQLIQAIRTLKLFILPCRPGNSNLVSGNLVSRNLLVSQKLFEVFLFLQKAYF